MLRGFLARSTEISTHLIWKSFDMSLHGYTDETKIVNDTSTNIFLNLQVERKIQRITIQSRLTEHCNQSKRTTLQSLNEVPVRMVFYQLPTSTAVSRLRQQLRIRNRTLVYKSIQRETWARFPLDEYLRAKRLFLLSRELSAGTNDGSIQF